AHSS
ncbi:bacterial extracellular solute-binding s, 5 Middle family protein, partial [Vibrio parahaemolyticus VPTS-2010_2]